MNEPLDGSTLSLQDSPSSSGRAFTIKAVLAGFLGAAAVNAFTQFNDEHLHNTLFVGNHLPASITFLILLLALVWNPLASLLGRWAMFSAKELAVTLTLILVSCWSPSSGFYRYFHRQLIMPFSYENEAWRKAEVLQVLPQNLFPLQADTTHPLYEKVYSGFLAGISSNQSMDDVYSAWLEPMVYWLPLIVIFVSTILALALVVHRQWAHHEQLSYPVAQIFASLIRQDKKRRLPDIFYSKLFLWGMAAVFCFHLLRLLYTWYPNELPKLETTWYMPLEKLWVDFNQVGGQPWGVKTGRIFFTIIGITYFISAEIGFTMGICNMVLMVVAGIYYSQTGQPFNGNMQEATREGAYLAYALILIYTGRSYYAAVFRKAFGFGKVLPEERNGVMAARLLVISFISFIGMLCIMGLDPFAAILYSLALMLLFLVFTRIVCETGIPFLQAGWMPGILLSHLLGGAALGPRAISFMNWMSTILVQDPREAMMPYVSNSLRVADEYNVKLNRLMQFTFAAVILALTVGFFARIDHYYKYGSYEDSWSSNWTPKLPFQSAQRQISELQATDQLEASSQAGLLDKLPMISPDWDLLPFSLTTFLAVVALSLARFRIRSWPIHPVLFLVWGTYPLQMTMYSFLIGWGIKSLVVRFGGGRVYQDLKPLFIGLILGEMLAIVAGILVALAYFFVTNNVPPAAFQALPS